MKSSREKDWTWQDPDNIKQDTVNKKSLYEEFINREEEKWIYETQRGVPVYVAL